MKSAVFFAPHDIRVKNVEKPRIGSNDVLLRIKAVAICNATDMHFLKGEIPGITYPLPPGKPGHECSGEIVEVGENIELLKQGDQVVPGPLYALPCGKCSYCTKGVQELCENPEMADFAYAEYLRVPASFCYPLPKDVTYDEGALIDLLACAVHAINRASISVGDSVTIIGQGPAGLLLSQLAILAGAEMVIGCDINDSRLRMSTKLGAHRTINSIRENPVEKVFELTGGKGSDIVIEAVGKPVTLQHAVKMLKPGGRAVVFGFHLMPAEMDIPRIFDKELEIKASFRTVGERDYGMATRLILRKKVNVKSLITHALPLEQIKRGLELIDKKESVIKVVLKP